LHEPDGHDLDLLELVFDHYDDVGFRRLIQLDRFKPAYGLQPLVQKGYELFKSIYQLCLLAEKADKRVRSLHKAYYKALEGLEVLKRQEKEDSSHDADVFLTAKVSQSQGKDEPALKVLSKSFGVVEEETARRRHVRAATVPEAEYTMMSFTDGLVSHRGDAIGTRRKGPHIPRIFTGSFSQLENDIRKLQLDKVSPTEPEPLTDGNIKIRDFGATPAISPCSTPRSETSLQRREALLSRETEMQHRVIRGEIYTSRRPSTKERARTLDGDLALDAWLKEDSPAKGPRDGGSNGVRRGHLPHREHTL
jgi:hypothetical protein